jgi:hypothetical protein
MFRNENFKFIVPITQKQFSMLTMFDFRLIVSGLFCQFDATLVTNHKKNYKKVIIYLFSNLGWDVPFKFGLHLICLCTILDPIYSIGFFLGV